MIQQDLLYTESVKAWIKTQENSIKSCEQAIEHARSEIKLLQEKITLETNEMDLKVRLLNQVRKSVRNKK